MGGCVWGVCCGGRREGGRGEWQWQRNVVWCGVAVVWDGLMWGWGAVREALSTEGGGRGAKRNSKKAELANTVVMAAIQ